MPFITCKSDTIKIAVIDCLLILLGFSMTACDSKEEYGTPSARYKIRGTTVDEKTGKPVPAIRTILDERISDEKVYGIDTIYTDNNGDFNFDIKTFPRNKFQLQVDDVDGRKNGVYENIDTTVDLTDIKYKGGGRWYYGEATVDLGEIPMKEAKQLEEDQNI
ncbi:MAG: radical SAM-associated putative lipoprotein [Rikenellaceae bacterium]|nr:radical SAM-associated putative lipoprotein [Rikenellaceae bacterium]